METDVSETPGTKVLTDKRKKCGPTETDRNERGMGDDGTTPLRY